MPAERQSDRNLPAATGVILTGSREQRSPDLFARWSLSHGKSLYCAGAILGSSIAERDSYSVLDRRRITTVFDYEFRLLSFYLPSLLSVYT